MVATTHMDLSLQLFAEKMFAPIMAGPLAKNAAPSSGRRDRSSAGGFCRQSMVVVSSEPSVLVEKIAAESKTGPLVLSFPRWRYIRFAREDGPGGQGRLQGDLHHPQRAVP
jgi:hypothetical protein